MTYPMSSMESAVTCVGLRYEYGIQPGQLIEMDFHQMTEIQARNAFKTYIETHFPQLGEIIIDNIAVSH